MPSRGIRVHQALKGGPEVMSKDMFGNDLTKTDSFGTPRALCKCGHRWECHQGLGGPCQDRPVREQCPCGKYKPVGK